MYFFCGDRLEHEISGLICVVREIRMCCFKRRERGTTKKNFDYSSISSLAWWLRYLEYYRDRSDMRNRHVFSYYVQNRLQLVFSQLAV
eukprot:snap_masked-scaffold_8-processed-gene-7.40-mRNA-1 protein AED:1.00 eAED:1.00 QI:0/0/0/0/1/1/2/0/87